MKILAVSLLLAAAIVSSASKPEGPFEAATLISYTTTHQAGLCSSTPTYGVTARSSDQKQISSIDMSCGDMKVRQYTLSFGGMRYQVEPERKIIRKDVLRDQLPGAHISLRKVGKGFEVMVGEKTSRYAIIGAEKEQ